ncbi:MAG: zinc-binding dehydrogenase [Acidobacteria bacterium]|nr:zinc-binding dehydrogenase [Acidobacteriota bacterium]
MRAALYSEYGSPDVIHVEDINRPKPANGEVLVRVRAAATNPYDWHFLRGTPYIIRLFAGLRRPRDRRLGVDLSGTVEALGPGVDTISSGKVAAGDSVFGASPGAFGEYVAIAADRLVRVPEGVGFQEAAGARMTGVTALQGLRDAGRLQAEQRVLINGASGGVGTMAVQIARIFGAEVTAVCSARNADAVRALGAHRVIDYTTTDFVADGGTFDLMFDAIGNRSIADCRSVLTRTGTYVLAGSFDDGAWLGPLRRGILIALLSPFVSQRLLGFDAKRSTDDAALIASWLASGEVRTVIDRTFPLDETAEAIRYLETYRASGKVLITP